MVLLSTVLSVISFVILARELATVHEPFSPVVLDPLSLWSVRIGVGVLCLWCIYVSRILHVQVGLAGAAGAGCATEYHAPVVQKPTGERARL